MENGNGLGGSHRGGGGGMAAVGNVPVWAAVAQSPAWTRGGSRGRARRRAREGKGEVSIAASGSFWSRRRRDRGGGPGVVAVWRAGTGKRGGPGRGMGQHGGAASVGSGAVWHVARPTE
jgi:hypothetical protein